jgi:DNA polymerase-3 subunit gamma/tau
VYKPVQGRFKVFMIDEVHMLTGHAFNAMLKTLEEPPDYLKFVLATTDPQKVPVTVLSRCLQFNLRPMAPETVQEHLVRVLEAESVAAEPAALRILSRAARGSMRDALSLTDQAIAYGGGGIGEANVRQMLGTVDRGHVFRMIEALANGDGKSVVEMSEALRTHGLSAASTLEEMSSVLQRMAVLQAVPEAASADDEEAQEIARLAQAMPADEVQLLYSICLHGRAELGLAPDEYAGLTMVLLRLLAFRQPAEKKTPSEPRVVDAPIPAPMPRPAGRALPVVEPAQPVPPAAAKPSSQGASVPVRVQPEPVREVQAAAAHATVTPTSEGDFWHELVQQLVAQEAITALVRELALQSQLVARDEGHWMLRVERESLNQPSSRERLKAALHNAGHAVDLSVEVGAVTDSPARRNAQAQAARQNAAEQVILNDPFVQSMMRDFGAKIVPGSIKPV